MEEKIKLIVSRYIKKSEDQINASTYIDRTAVSSSILLHRMYANLAEEGVVVHEYWDIHTYGDLLKKIGAETKIKSIECLNHDRKNTTRQNQIISHYIGVDIVELNEMPLTDNFRDSEFYKMNFAPKEIAYCLLKPNPIATFAGIFAAKEAIVKIDPNLNTTQFHLIEIEHLPSGKPIHSKYDLSISHSNNIAIAVAFNQTFFLENQGITQDPISAHTHDSIKINFWFYVLVLVSIFLNIHLLFKYFKL